MTDESKVVPVELTKPMHDAVEEQFPDIGHSTLNYIWKLLLDAAPHMRRTDAKEGECVDAES